MICLVYPFNIRVAPRTLWHSKGARCHDASNVFCDFYGCYFIHGVQTFRVFVQVEIHDVSRCSSEPHDADGFHLLLVAMLGYRLRSRRYVAERGRWIDRSSRGKTLARPGRTETLAPRRARPQDRSRRVLVGHPSFFADDQRVKPEPVVRGAKWTVDQGKEYIFYYGPIIWKSDQYYPFIERDWLKRYWEAGLPKHHPNVHYYLNPFPHGSGRGRPVGPETDPHSTLGFTKWLIKEIKSVPEPGDE